MKFKEEDMGWSTQMRRYPWSFKLFLVLTVSMLLALPSYVFRTWRQGQMSSRPKTELASAALTAAFAARDMDRAYLALVWGLPSPLEGEIAGAIGRDQRDRKRMAVVPRGGRTALTRYRTDRAWQTAASLLECRLATGRTHQIRVHLASRGNPIVGDPVYLRRVPAVARTLPEAIRLRLLDFPRQALHAASLGFAHPRTGRPLDFRTPLPADMAGLIDCLDALHAAQV